MIFSRKYNYNLPILFKRTYPLTFRYEQAQWTGYYPYKAAAAAAANFDL